MTIPYLCEFGKSVGIRAYELISSLCMVLGTGSA